jgi:microcompartment protein CcmK/EutM
MVLNPQVQFIRACSQGKAELVRHLLTAGVSPETRDSYGLTGLIWAGRKGNIEAAKLLLEFGADVNATDRRRRTALHHAVGSGQREFVRLITEKGASLAAVDRHGCTPLDLAILAADEEMISFLKSVGAPRVRTKDEQQVRDSGANQFSLSVVMGGTLVPDFIEREHQRLRGLFRNWKSEYCVQVKTFGFFLLVDGNVVCYSRREGTRGAQPARRSTDLVHMKIYVPQDWWTAGAFDYKKHLADAIEQGLQSAIALLRRKRHAIRSERLLDDWMKIKSAFLESSAPK